MHFYLFIYLILIYLNSHANIKKIIKIDIMVNDPTIIYETRKVFNRLKKLIQQIPHIKLDYK